MISDRAIAVACFVGAALSVAIVVGLEVHGAWRRQRAAAAACVEQVTEPLPRVDSDLVLLDPFADLPQPRWDMIGRSAPRRRRWGRES